MDSPSRDLDELLAALAEESAPGWSSADELGRLSIEAHARKVSGGQEHSPSAGIARLTGPGVTVHSASAAAAGRFLSGLQRLITAAGASRNGQTALGGPIATGTARSTQLALVAAPSAGSLVFNLDAGVDVSEERYPGRQGSLSDELGEVDQLLIEASFERVGELISAAASNDPESVGDKLRDYGPRLAAAAKEFSDNLVSAGFDLNLIWNPPGRASIKTSLPRSAAKFLSRVVSGQELDAENVRIVGILRTITDALKMIHVQQGDDPDEFTTISRGGVWIPREYFHERVVADVLERRVDKPDGTSKVSRTLKQIQLEEGESPLEFPETRGD